MRKIITQILHVFLLSALCLGVYAQSDSAPNSWNPIIKTGKGEKSSAGRTFSKMSMGPELHNQISNPNLEYMLNSVEVTDNDANSSLAADDFTIPAGETWDLSMFRMNGFGSNYAAVEGITVMLMNDVAGKPGDVFKKFKVTDNFRVDEWSDGQFIYCTASVTMPEVVTLTEGTYWVSFQTVGAMETLGAWGVLFQDSQEMIGNEYHWKNPGNASQFNLIDWTGGSDVVNVYGTLRYFPNLSYSIHAPVKENDLAIKEIVSPNSSSDLTATEQVIVTIQNYGSLAQNAYKVRYKVNEGTWFSDDVTIEIPAGESVEYVCRSAVDLSAVSKYTITAEVELATEENTSNTTISKTVYNYGTLYSSGVDTVITTCGGTFVDPGGLYGDYTDTTGRITFKPEKAGDLISLDFLDFSVSSGTVSVYNGTTVDAELLGVFDNEQLAGEKLIGINADGALTFDFIASAWEPTPGWVAFVQCLSPVADDFAVEKIFMNRHTIFEQEQVEFSAIVRNRGTQAQIKDVSFTANGIEIATVSSKLIELGQTDTVSVVWTPTLEGDYLLEASVIADENAEANNTLSLNTIVYKQGRLVESFEVEGVFPPELWTQTNPGRFVRVEDGFFQEAYDGKHSTFINAMDEDTLITPCLDIKDGDTFSFFAKSPPWRFGAIDVVFSESPNGPWNVLESVVLNENFRYTETVIDLSVIPGKYYLGFAALGEVSIDFIRGPMMFFYNNDIAVLNIEGSKTPVVNEEAIYNVRVKNIGTQSLVDGDYAVKLFTKSGNVETEVASVNGVALKKLESHVFNIANTFTAVEETELYAKVEYASDEDLTTNQTNSLKLTVQKSGTEYITVGEGEEEYHLVPFSPTNLSSGGELFYKSIEIGKTGEIHGLSFYYSCTTELSDTLMVFVVETDSVSLEEKIQNAHTYSLVYNKDVDFKIGNGQELYIPFEKPYLYGGKNLKVLLYWPYSYISSDVVWEISNTTDVRCNSISQCYLNKGIDIYDQNVLNNEWTNHYKMLPKTRFFVKTTERDASLSGTVYNENNVVFEGVEISVEGFANKIKTDRDGAYSFPVMPIGDNAVTAISYGYFDNTKTAAFTSATETVVDFNMEALPNVSVSGTVLSNDYNTPVEGAEVKLEGYKEYSAVTNAQGVFTFNDVYVAQEYVITIAHQKMHPYTDNVKVPIENLDLGEIVLDEIEQSAFNMVAERNAENFMNIQWKAPHSGKERMLSSCDMTSLSSDNYTANSPDEDVQIGNLFRVNKPGTVTSFTFKVIGSNYLVENGAVNIKVYNKERQLVLESESFEMPNRPHMMTVDIPDFTYTEDFYAMIHWDRLHSTTPFIGYDNTEDNVAYVIFNNSGEFQLLTDVASFQSGALRMGANIIEEGTASSKSVEHYNISRSKLEDSQNSANWLSLAQNITETSFVDESWSLADSGMYVYQLETVYTETNAATIYSNSVAKDVFVDLLLNVTTNSSVSAEGAKVLFENKDGSEIHVYEAMVNADGNAKLPKVIKGEYKMKISLSEFEDYTQDLSITLDKEFSVELIEYKYAPANLMVTVDNPMQNVNLNWGLGESTTIKYDDEVYESGYTWPEGEAHIGNLFDTETKGHLVSINLYGITNETIDPADNAKVSLELFDADFQLIGKTDEFQLPADDWMTINLNNLEYSGAFYAMVRISNGATNYLAMDHSGTNGYFYHADYGLLSMAEAAQQQGVFLMRANVLVNGASEVKSISTIQNPNKPVEIQKLSKINKQGKALTASESRAVLSYNVYLNDMTTPIATDLTTREYVFTNEFVANGKQTAGVSAVYTTGESQVSMVDFDVLYVGVEELNEESIQVYPNPARDVISISNAQGAFVEIFDMKGALVKAIVMDDNIVTIDVNNLESGSYMLRIKNTSGVITKNINIAR